MGLILSFPQAERKPLARRAAEIPQGGADILFFTGVRYKRRDEAAGERDGNARGSNGPRRRQRRRKAT